MTSIVRWTYHGAFRLRIWMAVACALCSLACDGTPQLAVEFSDAEWRRMRGAKLPEMLPADPSNRYADDPRVADFGETLFFDERLSPEGVTCATCHPPEENWGVGSVDFGAFSRRVPSLLNVGHQRWFGWAGQNDTLWSQIVGPLENPREMKSDRLYLAHAIFDNPDLREAFETHFFEMPPLDDLERFPMRGRPGGSDDDPLQESWLALTEEDRAQIDDVLVAVAKAIAAYERTLLTEKSAFDVFVEQVEAGETGAALALSPVEQQGAKLFFGDAQCHLCHSGPMFSDFEFHNLGLPSQNAVVPDLGRLAGVDRVLRDPFNLLSRHNDDPDEATADKIRFLRTDSSQSGQFKTPSLRNAADRGPYMHSGELETLSDVVDFYARLPGVAAVGHREETLVELTLAPEDLDSLIAFLHALSAPERVRSSE